MISSLFTGKMGKKVKTQASRPTIQNIKMKMKSMEPPKFEERKFNSSFILDTTYITQNLGHTSWEGIYDFIENSEWKGPSYLDDESYNNLVEFEVIKMTKFHKVVAKVTMFPYYDMVSWILSHTHIQTCSIVDHNRNVIAFCRPKASNLIYKPIPPKIPLKTYFLNHFHSNAVGEKNKYYIPLIKKWLHELESSKLKIGKDYPKTIFKRPQSFIIKIIFILYGESNPEHCKVEWVPLVHSIFKQSKRFNWACIMSQNLSKEIKLSLASPPRFL